MATLETTTIPADHLLEAKRLLDLIKQEARQRDDLELIESLEKTAAMVGALLARVLN